MRFSLPLVYSVGVLSTCLNRGAAMQDRSGVELSVVRNHMPNVGSRRTVADTVAGTSPDELICAYTMILEAIENTGQYKGN